MTGSKVDAAALPCMLDWPDKMNTLTRPSAVAGEAGRRTKENSHCQQLYVVNQSHRWLPTIAYFVVSEFDRIITGHG